MKIYHTILFPTLFALAVSSAVGAEVALPPFTYTGRVLNYENGDLADTASGAEIRARKDGVLLAVSPIVRVAGTVCNYSLSIPMSSENAVDTARPGDSLTFEIDLNTGSGGVIQATNSFVSVGAPGRVALVDVCAAADSDGDGVSDQYESMVVSLMRAYGLSGEFDATADYDGDGSSNLKEYLAGTNPFSADDDLRILSFENISGDEDMAKITFLPGRSRAYTVQETTNSVANHMDFKCKSFRLGVDREAVEYDLLQTGAGYDEVAIRTLYLLKDSADAGLYRLRLE